MKTFTFKGFIASIFLVAISATNSFSQGTPIGCNGQFFVTHGSGGTATSTTSVKKLSFSGGTITPNVFNIDPTAIGFNAIGINPVDGYMYGLRYPTSNNRPRLVRVGSGGSGNIVDLGEVSNGGGNMADGDLGYAGCFDAAGVFYFITDQNEMYKITGLNYPASNTTTTYIGAPAGGGSGTNFYVDMAINPVTGILYGVTYNQRLYTINTTTGTSTFIATHGTTGYIASLFFDEIGNLYGYHQNGAFYLIDKTTAALTAAGSGPSYTYADGCSCSFGNVFHDLSWNPVNNTPCPSNSNKNPTTNISVSVTNNSSVQRTGLTYTFDLSLNDAAHKFMFNQSAGAIAQNLFDAGLLPNNNSSNVSLQLASGAPAPNYNKIVVSNFQTGNPGETKSATFQLKFVGTGTPNPIPMQSFVSGLPALLGSSDESNDPATPAPNDPTYISFCPGATLPVKLLSFTGAYKNNTTYLNWVTENQVNFSYYDIERSEDGTSFSSIGLKSATGNSSSKESYQFNDDLTSFSGSTYYYRLKMIDTDGNFKYTSIILIRKDQKGMTDIIISPNPVAKGNTVTLRFESVVKSVVDIKVIDMAGRIMFTQQNNAIQGINSVSINHLERLLPGMYLLQMNDGSTVQTTKFTIAR